MRTSFGLISDFAMTGAEAFEAVMGRGTALALANGWRLARRRTMGADRVEIEGPVDGDTDALKRMGCTVEIVVVAGARLRPRRARPRPHPRTLAARRMNGARAIRIAGPPLSGGAGPSATIPPGNAGAPRTGHRESSREGNREGEDELDAAREPARRVTQSWRRRSSSRRARRPAANAAQFIRVHVCRFRASVAGGSQSVRSELDGALMLDI